MSLFETIIDSLLSWLSIPGSELTQKIKPKLELKCMVNVSNICWHILDQSLEDVTQQSALNWIYYSLLIFNLVLITLTFLIYLIHLRIPQTKLVSFNETCSCSSKLDHMEALGNKLIQINLILENMIKDTRSVLDCNTRGGLKLTNPFEKYTFQKLKSNLNKEISQFNQQFCLLNSNCNNNLTKRSA